MSTVREVTYELLRELELTEDLRQSRVHRTTVSARHAWRFKYFLGLHERSAAGIALGYAMGRGKAAFVNLHSVASVGNGLSAIIDAHYNHVPLVVTSGQQDRRQVPAEPFLVSRAVEVVKPYVKWACEPLRAEGRRPQRSLVAITSLCNLQGGPCSFLFPWMIGRTSASP